MLQIVLIVIIKVLPIGPQILNFGYYQSRNQLVAKGGPAPMIKSWSLGWFGAVYRKFTKLECSQ